MKVKCFEVRDRATFMPCVAVKMESTDEAESYLLRRAGYNPTAPPLILFGHMEGGKFAYDKYDHPGNSTRTTAHDYIEKHFDALVSGSVICTEFIRGERETPKPSERGE